METPFSPSIPEPTKNSKSDWFEKYQYYILGLLSVGLVTGIYFTIAPKASLDHSATTEPEVASDSADSPAPTSGQIVVDIAGAVIKSGVYYLPANSIVEDAIVMAGGLNKNADLDEIARSVNRAEIIQAHSKIYIPKKGDSRVVYTAPATSAAATTSTTTQGTSININTASASELDILPGIGPVIAQRIIDYRIQNGNFASIESIKNVPGISEGKYDQLKELIGI